MQSSPSFSFLRRALAIDASASAAMSIALLTLAPQIAALTDLPSGLLREAGVVLLPFVAFVGFLATRREPARIGVWIVIALNAVWVVDSFLLLFTGWVEPNGLGYVFILAQAVAVAVFAELEYVGLQRARGHESRALGLER